MTSGWVSHRGMKKNCPRKPGVAAERPVVSLGHKMSLVASGCGGWAGLRGAGAN